MEMGEISLCREGDAYVLRGQTTEGANIAIPLSDDDVMRIAQSAPTFRQEIMARRHPGAVFATPIIQTGVSWDAMGGSVLVRLGFSANGHLIGEMRPNVAAGFATQLRECLEEKPAVHPTRQ